MSVRMLSLLGRESRLFDLDIELHGREMQEEVAASRFLVIGCAGSIGQAVVREIFRRVPLTLDVIDISENNTVELLRHIRSPLGYIKGNFRTFAIDYGCSEFKTLTEAEGPYDNVFNFSACKHWRSEEDT